MEEKEEIYSELYSVLNLLGKSYIEKLPKQLYQLIENSRNPNYLPKYSFNEPLVNQNINKKTISMLALIDLNYWRKDNTEKQELVDILNRNKKMVDEYQSIKYNTDNLFKNVFDLSNSKYCINYYYTLRCNIVHRGKSSHSHIDLLMEATEDLLNIFEYMLEDAFGEE